MNAYEARIAELEEQLTREQHVRKTAERESIQHAERRGQLCIERDAALSELAAARHRTEALLCLRAADLEAAWMRYIVLFGRPPHGTSKQCAALLELLPKHDDSARSATEGAKE